MKVYVYAISKNEEKFADRFMDSASEADGVFVLDTGSDDNTREILRRRGATVGYKKVTPWRFDTARNLSLEMVPSDADICVCFDLDEVFLPGWRSVLEQAWGDANRASYRYTWSFNADGSEGVVFWIDKIHSRKGFRWSNPVHETLRYDGDLKYCYPEIRLEHHPDHSKSRAAYLPLLELSVKENPYDDRGMHYLGREYMFHGRYDEAITVLKKHLDLPSAVWADERCASMRFIAKCLLKKGDTAAAEKWLLRAAAEAPHLREPFVELAALLFDRADYYGTVFFVERALAIAERPKTYINEPYAWGSLPHDLAAVSLYRLGQYSAALPYASRAAQLAPGDERIKGNLKIISEAVDAL